jgi:DMSO/TMAO reductase YedYZ molybdopterin-dependent catalytic subunit
MIDRRRFVGAAGLGLLGGLLPRLARGDRFLLEHTPDNLETPLAWFDREITPTQVFFVRSHFGPPSLDRSRRLRIHGLVRRSLFLGLDDLKRFSEASAISVLQCAGNGRALHRPRVPGVQWRHGAMGQARWSGVRLRDLLEAAGLRDGARHVRLAGADLPPSPAVPRFIRSLPIERALDPATLLATRMNGAPLPLVHGAPFRLVVPGWAGDHWVKWLSDLRVQEEEAEGFYMRVAYRMPGATPPGGSVSRAHPLTTFPVKSAIASPRNGARRPPGPQEVIGVAFSGEAAIARVEISLDGGSAWRDATLTGTPERGKWNVFRLRFDAPRPGVYRAIARATDARGARQPRRTPWNPSGYLWNGWHSVDWSVG